MPSEKMSRWGTENNRERKSREGKGDEKGRKGMRKEGVTASGVECAVNT